MTPAHDTALPRDDLHEHSPADPIPHSRRHRAPSPRKRRRPRPARPSTVWFCAQDGPCAGTGLLADWLLAAVVKMVTAYTRPGQRVLLLCPALCFAPSTPHTSSRGNSRPGLYAGLHEAAWTVVRLGRGVQTLTAFAHSDAVDERPNGTCGRSRPGLGIARPTAGRLSAPSASGGHGPVPPETRESSDCYDLVIVAAEPRAAAWFNPVGWADLLAPSGVFTVVTRSRRQSGRLADPAVSLLRVAEHAGLHYLDRIALLREPVRVNAMPVVQPRSLEQPPARHALTYDDLFVFTRQQGSASSNHQDGDLR